MQETTKRIVWIACVCAMGVAIVFVCLFIFAQPFRVLGNSMSPTYTHNDLVFVNVIATNYSTDDVVVIQYGKEKIIKRIYAEYGDVVDIAADGIYINHSFITANDEGYEETSYCLDKNEYFVLGDNFKQSIDSRYFGVVTSDKIVGKVLG